MTGPSPAEREPPKGRASFVVRGVLAGAIALLAAPAAATTVRAGPDDLSHCGGNGQRPCRVWETVPSCDSGLEENFGTDKCQPKPKPKPKPAPVTSCGGKNETPCKMWERVPSCDAGLVEDFLLQKCVYEASRSNPTCGAKGKNACKVWERIPSCDSGLKESGGKCVVPTKQDKAYLAMFADVVEPLGDCEWLLRGIPRQDLSWDPAPGARGLSPACAQEMYRGMLCALPETLANSVDFASKASVQFDKAPCNQYGLYSRERPICAGVTVVTKETGGAIKCLAAGIKTGAFNDFMQSEKAKKFICKEMGSMLVTLGLGSFSTATRVKQVVEALKATVKTMSAAKSMNRTAEALAKIPECGGNGVAGTKSQLPKTVNAGKSYAPYLPLLFE